jgi:hypothetical protein
MKGTNDGRATFVYGRHGHSDARRDVDEMEELALMNKIKWNVYS